MVDRSSLKQFKFKWKKSTCCTKRYNRYIVPKSFHSEDQVFGRLSVIIGKFISTSIAFFSPWGATGLLLGDWNLHMVS